MANTMDENTLDKIGQLAERLDDALFMLKTTGSRVPPQTHIEGMSGTMTDVRDDLAKIYAENGGTEELNIQA